MEEERKQKWESKASIEIAVLKAAQVWPILEDFCNFHKWFPIDTCYQVDGASGQPGLIRYTAATTTSSSETIIKWAKEKLLMIDPIQRCLSYQVLDNNIGIKSYVGTFKVLPINGNDDHKGGCKIEWSFVCAPMDGWKLEDFLAYVEYCLQFMAKKIDDALLP
ncbi:lachrymatory-factor synthase-like [Quillaja saponaria]|uniref:Lachrymatory-factor synthase-like n=1 Tax=Quillaja saponaria TaxID=32244 RepID=A0AAD7LIS5_QUISA|nr:lachrymatory-factor synthase-like [Quillaja saponaria]